MMQKIETRLCCIKIKHPRSRMFQDNESFRGFDTIFFVTRFYALAIVCGILIRDRAMKQIYLLWTDHDGYPGNRTKFYQKAKIFASSGKRDWAKQFLYLLVPAFCSDHTETRMPGMRNNESDTENRTVAYSGSCKSPPLKYRDPLCLKCVFQREEKIQNSKLIGVA